jgi:hypothetical protein
MAPSTIFPCILPARKAPVFLVSTGRLGAVFADVFLFFEFLDIEPFEPTDDAAALHSNKTFPAATWAGCGFYLAIYFPGKMKSRPVCVGRLSESVTRRGKRQKQRLRFCFLRYNKRKQDLFGFN